MASFASAPLRRGFLLSARSSLPRAHLYRRTLTTKAVSSDASKFTLAVPPTLKSVSPKSFPRLSDATNSSAEHRHRAPPEAQGAPRPRAHPLLQQQCGRRPRHARLRPLADGRVLHVRAPVHLFPAGRPGPGRRRGRPARAGAGRRTHGGVISVAGRRGDAASFRRRAGCSEVRPEQGGAPYGQPPVLAPR